MGNIVTAPSEKMNDLELSFKISYKTGKEETLVFNIRTNIKPDDMEVVMENWLVRTEEYTVESLVEYINSKSKFGFIALAIRK